LDAASFILAGEIRNSTNTHKNKQQPIYPYFAYTLVWIIKLRKLHVSMALFISQLTISYQALGVFFETYQHLPELPCYGTYFP